MLALACVCVPVLGVVLAGLLGDYRYLADLRRMREAVTSLAERPGVARPATVSERSAA